MYSSDSEIRYTLIVAAAGIGKRMNLGYPKQFLEYRGKPLFILPLEKAQGTREITDIIVVTGEESVDFVKEQCKKYEITKIKEIIPGGKERQDSIYNAIKLCEDADIIAVQDGVRPFLKGEYLIEGKRILEENRNIDGVVVGVPVKDTIKIIDRGGNIIATPDRNLLMAAQTPQIFRGHILREAYERAFLDNFLGTDDSSLVERLEKQITFLKGSYENIKITTPEDLKFLEQEEK